MGDVIFVSDYRRSGPEAVRALLAFELAPGVTVHDAAWTFAMPDEEYEQSDRDPDQMADLLDLAGLAYYSGNDDQPAALVLRNESRFRACIKTLACRESAMNALGTGILIRREPERCA